MAEQKLNVLLDKLVQVKISFENIEQNKTNKFWCDQHKYNTSHETKDCCFLNKIKEAKMIKQVHQKALSDLKANFEIKQDSQNIDQTKIKKSWCDHHKYNKSHATQNCYFLNKKNKRTKEIKQAEATDDDVFHSADDRSETEGQY